MSSRIRYNPTEEVHIFESAKVYVSESTGARYKVFINTQEFSYRIRNELSKTNIIKREGKISNLNVLKRAAKKSLEKLGVKFSDEQRMRTFGLCDKGYNQKKHLNNKLPSDSQTE